MPNIVIKINKKNFKASIDMQGYQGTECLTDFNNIIQALKAEIEYSKDKFSEVVHANQATLRQ